MALISRYIIKLDTLLLLFGRFTLIFYTLLALLAKT